MSIADYWAPIQQILLAENPALRDRLGSVQARSADAANELELVTSSQKTADWLCNGSGMIERLRELMPRLAGRQPKIMVRVDEQAQPRPAAARSGLAAKYSFENFISGSSNEIAFGAARQLACEAGRAEQLCPLYIHGSVGLGKTHLANAIGNQYLRLHPDARVRLLSGEQFMREVQRDFTSDRVETFRRRFRELDLLIIDDIQLIGRESAQTHKQLIALFNFLGDQSRPFAVVSDSPPGQLPLPSRLISRLNIGVQARIEPPDPATRLGILRQQAQLLDLNLSDDCARLLSENLRSNCRELIGALRRVAATAKVQPRQSQLDIARAVLADLHTIPTRITVECIIDATARHFGQTRRDLQSKRRTKLLAQARHIAMYLCRELTAQSLPGIGGFFGCHHSSVLHAHRKIAASALVDPQTKAAIDQIRRQLEG